MIQEPANSLDPLGEDNVMLERRSIRAPESVHRSRSLDCRKAGGGEADLMPDFGTSRQLRRLTLDRPTKKIGGNPRKSAARYLP